MSDGRVRRAYLGLAGGGRPLPPKAARPTGQEKGIEVITVVAGSPAARAGLGTEEIILSVDGVATADVGALQRLMTADRIGKQVPVGVFRRGRVDSVQVTPTELVD